MRGPPFGAALEFPCVQSGYRLVASGQHFARYCTLQSSCEKFRLARLPREPTATRVRPLHLSPAPPRFTVNLPPGDALTRCVPRPLIRTLSPGLNPCPTTTSGPMDFRLSVA